MATKIIIDIPLDGDIEVSISGVSGPSCEQETKEIEEALGSVKNKKKTQEYYQPTTQKNQLKQK